MSSDKYDVAVVGGGLAGLTVSAYLSSKGKRVVLLERGQLGGRAVTLSLKGFNFNFGAHAIYGRDTSILTKLEKELGIQIAWKDFNPNKARYDIGDGLTEVPANIQGLFRTRILKASKKIIFTYEIVKTIIGVEDGNPHISIKQWLDRRQLDEEVKEMMLTLASSNFFTREPELIPSHIFFQYYKRLFHTSKPVAYIGGGWQALIQELTRVIEENQGTILTKAKVEGIQDEDHHILQIQTAKESISADEFVFCIPPKELVKIFKDSEIEPILHYYSKYKSSDVVVYDVGLHTRIDVPYTYIYDKKNKIFITDLSYYDETAAPESGQLLQAIAYLGKDDVGKPAKTEEYIQKIEALYDKHFTGWRDVLVVPRISKKAAAQEITWMMTQNPMPLYFPEYRNLFFAGDWCTGQGQLSELSFSSAYEVCQMILNKS